MLLDNGAHMCPIAFRIRDITRVTFLFDMSLASPSFSLGLDLSKFRIELMRILDGLTRALAHPVVLGPINALLTPDATDCDCAVSV